MCAARLNQNREAVVTQQFHQWLGVFLEQRLAAGQFHERQTRCWMLDAGCWIRKRRSQSVDFFQDFRQRLFFASGEGVSGVAVGTAEVAAGKADENARQPGKGAFTLQTQKNFVDDEGLGHKDSLTGREEKEMFCNAIGFLSRGGLFFRANIQNIP